MRRRSAILLTLGGLAPLLGGGAAGPVLAVSVEPVALSGDPAPGTGGGSFSGFSRPVLSDGGALAFKASSSSGSGVWSRPAGGGALQIEAQVGDPRPEFGPGVTLYEVEALSVDDAGETVWVGRVQGLPGLPSLSGTVVWVPDGSGGHAVELESGDPAPGVPGAEFSFFDGIRVGDSGELTFRGSLLGPGVDGTNDFGIWAPDAAGEPQLVVRQGDPVSGFPGETFHLLTSQLNAAGDVAVEHDGLGIWSTRGPGTFDTLFQVGDPAPGAPGAGSFTDFDRLMLNDRGGLAFNGKSGSFGGIWVSDAGQDLELRVGAGDPLPGAPGVQMVGNQLLAFNDAGDVAFQAILSGVGVSVQNDFALVGPDGAGGTHVIYREGDEIAGLPGRSIGNPQQVLLNAAGDAVILAQTGLGLGLLVAPAGGGLHLVAIQGRPFEVAPGDVRTIYAFGEWDLHTNFIELLPGSLSDARRFAFEAFFADGNQFSSGLFVVTIPEPGTALLVLGGLLGLAAGRSGRRSTARAYSA